MLKVILALFRWFRRLWYCTTACMVEGKEDFLFLLVGNFHLCQVFDPKVAVLEAIIL